MSRLLLRTLPFVLPLSLWSACAGSPDGAPGDAGSPAAAFESPPTRTADVVDDYHGTSVPDPYRWLEDQDSAEVAEWVRIQNAVTRRYLDGAPGREALRERLTELWDHPRRSAPYEAGDHWLQRRNDGLQEQSVLYRMPSPDAPGEAVLDPNTLSEEGTTALGPTAVSEDGRHLAYALAESGSDWHTWHVLDLTTGATLADRIPWSKFAGAAWTHDGAGFFYQRYPAPEEGETYEAVNRSPQLCYHRLGTDAGEDPVVYERPDQPDWGFSPWVTDDGRYLVITIWEGTDERTRVACVDLDQEDWKVEPLLMDFDAEYDVFGSTGSTFYIRTNKDAPFGKVVALDLEAGDDAAPTTVVPAGEHALQSATILDGRLVLTYLVDAHHEVRVASLEGEDQGTVPLPGLGSVGGFRGKQDAEETYFSFQSFVHPPSVHHLALPGLATTPYFTPDIDHDPSGLVTRQVFLQSQDGTRLPMFLVHREGLSLDGTHPTYLYGYGGFDISLTPSFSVENLVWVERGGVYAHAILRGGGEYGDPWHEAGMLDRKQNVFDDFIACAQYLIRNGWSSRDTLAIGGRSNGGLLVGACLTQRPDLFGAAIPEVGVLDMLRFHEFTIGWAWVPEYGSSEDPDQFAFLHEYSPLHNIEPGTAYPPTMIMTSDHDDRVLPGHSYKFGATLQAAQGGDAPILLRVETSSGHGAGTPTSKKIEKAVDRWAFLERALQPREP